jgi:hypothetical protein
MKSTAARRFDRAGDSFCEAGNRFLATVNPPAAPAVTLIEVSMATDRISSSRSKPLQLCLSCKGQNNYRRF